jgi:hypothetical protein
VERGSVAAFADRLIRARARAHVQGFATGPNIGGAKR